MVICKLLPADCGDPQQSKRFFEEKQMTNPEVHSYNRFGELDGSHGPDYDHELLDETPIDEMLEVVFGEDAKRCVERRAESQWLREQLADWDDWDEYFDNH
jgi:hypothetical protein